MVSQNKSKVLSHFEDDKLNVALGDLSRLNTSLNLIEE